MTERLIYVNLPHACYGILVKEGLVIDAPPIAKWMKGHSTKEVRDWLDSKGAQYIVIS